MAVQPELSSLVPELNAELRARLESDGEQKSPEALLRALLVPHEPLPEERERRLPATVRQDASGRKWLLGGEARAEAEALLKERAQAAMTATLRQMLAESLPAPNLSDPATKEQDDLDYTFANPTHFERWPERLKEWAIRFGLHTLWLELADQPGGQRLRALKMLNALSGCLELYRPGATLDVIASPAVTEVYAQEIPGGKVDVVEWLLRAWHARWTVDGQPEFVGCRDSARAIAKLLNHLGTRLRHSPPKEGEDFPPHSIFRNPSLYLRVSVPPHRPPGAAGPPRGRLRCGRAQV